MTTQYEYPHPVEDNDPDKRGTPAGPRHPIGAAVQPGCPIHSRFGIVWFVERVEQRGEHLVAVELVRTEPTFAKAVKGLK